MLISACLKEVKKLGPEVKNESRNLKVDRYLQNAVEDSISEDVQSKVVGVSYDYKN